MHETLPEATNLTILVPQSVNIGANASRDAYLELLHRHWRFDFADMLCDVGVELVDGNRLNTLRAFRSQRLILNFGSSLFTSKRGTSFFHSLYCPNPRETPIEPLLMLTLAKCDADYGNKDPIRKYYDFICWLALVIIKLNQCTICPIERTPAPHVDTSHAYCHLR